MVVGLIGAMIMVSITGGCQLSVRNGCEGLSADKTAEVANVNQFFNFILERFAFVCSVAVISVVSIVLGHVGIRGLDVLRGGRMRSA